MTCKSCKDTRKIQLLHSTVECTDCQPKPSVWPVSAKAGDLVEIKNFEEWVRHMTPRRAELVAWQQSVSTDAHRHQFVELRSAFHNDPIEQKLDETDAQFRERFSKPDPRFTNLLDDVKAVDDVSHVSCTPKDGWTIEVYVVGGNDYAVACAIWDALPLVVATAGNTCVAVNTDRGPVNVYFSRPANT